MDPNYGELLQLSPFIGTTACIWKILENKTFLNKEVQLHTTFQMHKTL